jgi:ferredoxin-NADP reductase
VLFDHEYHTLAVAAVIEETADTRSFVLEIPPARRDRFAYSAGQYCTFRATVDGERVVRCYSMSSSPDVDEPFTTTVKRVPGGRMSNWMNDALGPGDTIEVLRPAGLFVLRPTDAPIVAFAGGSGITPVISIVKSALATTGRPVSLVYANRSPDAVIFAAALERLRAASEGRLCVHHHLDSQRGFLDPAGCATLVGGRTDADFYVCGPGPYMATVEAGLALLGVDPSRVLVERFAVDPADGAPAATAGRTAAGAADGTAERTAEGAGAPPTATTETVVIRLDRRTSTLGHQAGDTVLETARRAGLNPPFSCEAGSCATCMARLDDGTVAMRVNNALSTDEVAAGWILTCQALPTSPTVVVDYDG